MKLLVIAATPFEFYEFRQHCLSLEEEMYNNNVRIDFKVTGVGLVPTIYHLMDIPADELSQYDGILQMGIAGSFRTKYAIGDIVQVVSEVFGDAGAEEADGGILDLFDLNLWESNDEPFHKKIIYESLEFPLDFKVQHEVHGLTVSLGSGQLTTIQHRRKKFAADIESMEGAAFFYFAQKKYIPCRQIRCISNPITPRDVSQWQIKKSIDTLNEFMMESINRWLHC